MSRIGPTSLRLEPLYIKVRPPLVLSPLFFDQGHWEALQGYVIRQTSSLTKIGIIVITMNTITIQIIGIIVIIITQGYLIYSNLVIHGIIPLVLLILLNIAIYKQVFTSGGMISKILALISGDVLICCICIWQGKEGDL